MEGVFKFKNLTYDFQNPESVNEAMCQKSNVSSVKYGTEAITSLDAKTWKI